MLVGYYRNVPAASPTGPPGAQADYSIDELDRPAPPRGVIGPLLASW
jgi:hypothetical protein